MIESIDTSLIDWSRAQFALTAMYHWLFVPLTLGLGVIQAILETIYYKTGDEFWKKTAQFWMKLFGINFAIGVATGLILERTGRITAGSSVIFSERHWPSKVSLLSLWKRHLSQSCFSAGIK